MDAMSINLNPVTGVPGESLNVINDWMVNPIVLFIVLIVIFIYYALFSSSSSEAPIPTGANGGTRFFEILVWGIFLTVLLANGLRYFYGSNILAKIRNLFGEVPELDITVTQPKLDLGDVKAPGVPEMTFEKQVFHIPGNEYTYDNAKAVCAAYGGRLADYKEMREAYEDGADWCSYGWSKDQMAFYPTQEEKWKKLQKIEGHEHDCGRPGINGGYIANPNVKFGINCYGYKPDITAEEAKLMRTTDGLPITKKEQKFNELVKYWKTKIPDILVAPFNHANWSAF